MFLLVFQLGCIALLSCVILKHAYNRRSEVVPLKLPKSPPTVEPKLTSCAVVQEGACVCLGQSISHLCHSLQGSRIIRRGMLRTMTSVMVLRLRIVILGEITGKNRRTTCDKKIERILSTHKAINWLSTHSHMAHNMSS
jgi:hypothetical protein